MNENIEEIIQNNDTNEKVASKSPKLPKIILFSVAALLIVVITLSLILILPLFTKNHIKNTFDVLFFDTDVLSKTATSLNDSGYE